MSGSVFAVDSSDLQTCKITRDENQRDRDIDQRRFYFEQLSMQDLFSPRDCETAKLHDLWVFQLDNLIEIVKFPSSSTERCKCILSFKISHDVNIFGVIEKATMLEDSESTFFIWCHGAFKLTILQVTMNYSDDEIPQLKCDIYHTDESLLADIATIFRQEKTKKLMCIRHEGNQGGSGLSLYNTKQNQPIGSLCFDEYVEDQHLGERFGYMLSNHNTRLTLFNYRAEPCSTLWRPGLEIDLLLLKELEEPMVHDFYGRRLRRRSRFVDHVTFDESANRLIAFEYGDEFRLLCFSISPVGLLYTIDMLDKKDQEKEKEKEENVENNERRYRHKFYCRSFSFDHYKERCCFILDFYPTARNARNNSEDVRKYVVVRKVSFEEQTSTEILKFRCDKEEQSLERSCGLSPNGEFLWILLKRVMSISKSKFSFRYFEVTSGKELFCIDDYEMVGDPTRYEWNDELHVCVSFSGAQIVLWERKRVMCLSLRCDGGKWVMETVLDTKKDDEVFKKKKDDLRVQDVIMRYDSVVVMTRNKRAVKWQFDDDEKKKNMDLKERKVEGEREEREVEKERVLFMIKLGFGNVGMRVIVRDRSKITVPTILL